MSRSSGCNPNRSPSKASLEARGDTLRAARRDRGGDRFLLGEDGAGTKRVELNAMTSDVFIAFLERKLREAGVEKMIPDDDVLEQHARRLLAQKFAAEVLEKARPGCEAKAAKTKLPGDYRKQIAGVLEEEPDFCWDQAVAVVLGVE